MDGNDVFDEVFGGEQEHLPEEPENETSLPDADDQPTDSGNEEPGELTEQDNDDADASADEQPEAEKEQSETEPENDEADFQTRINELEQQLEASDKRVRDNQSSYHKEHQARLELEKEIEKLKAKEAGEDWAFLDDDKPDADDSGKSKPQAQNLDAVKQELSTELQTELERKMAWDMAEKEVRAEHGDYDELLENVLLPELQGSESLQAKFREQGGSPQVAYEMAKKIADRKEYEKDPDAYIAAKIAEKEQSQTDTGEPKPEKKPRQSSGLSLNNAPPPDGNSSAGGNDVFDEVYG